MNKLVLSLLFFILFLTSCVNKSKNEKLSQVDSLLSDVHAMHQSLSGFNFDSINIIVDETRNLMQVYSNADSKSLSNSDFKLFDYCGNIQRTFTKFNGAYSNIQKEITYSEQQLKDLMLDVKDDKISDSLFVEVIKTETEIILQLESDIKTKLDVLNSKWELYRIVKNEIQVLYNKLNINPDITKELKKTTENK